MVLLPDKITFISKRLEIDFPDEEHARTGDFRFRTDMPAFDPTGTFTTLFTSALPTDPIILPQRVDVFVALSKVREREDLTDSEVSIKSVTLLDAANNPVHDPQTNALINLVKTPDLPFGSFVHTKIKEFIGEITISLSVRNSDTELVGQISEYRLL